MYIRTTQRKNKDGSVIRYVQLAHNFRDEKTGQARAKVLYSFGREDQVDKDSLQRLVASIEKFLGPEEALDQRLPLPWPWVVVVVVLEVRLNCCASIFGQQNERCTGEVWVCLLRAILSMTACVCAY